MKLGICTVCTQEDKYSHAAMFTKELFHRLLSNEAPLVQPPEDFLSNSGDTIECEDDIHGVYNLQKNVCLQLQMHLTC